ncbi:uncharacterized protein LACBIDRAFT_299879 [Laccaria bicolor S238N-H82]|uniref:Predicted protein n=1 Tax=Laccaria bicolor (strain S238N-H82 / ATCC MYA-4686) TaxID=486041 RepID=B0DJM6_LACBS|nr:uncharacterized protein LACBIDRAFT_303524 [Laccaria bicolor S238N-H82]XP_001890846.1 uncharacterized protein LACBIDRAFT_299879 [Laccaria bicolor S238N-H82]EDQ98502.1 predicted protein [Laccaria bicolor S238N-H82]EDR05235.1 predicted protein [Laccaria bicolor S238N-H82]|eukprot:XP_001884200.1 predicted protein [Laccaria bicolor S238N-H82]
MRSGLQQKELLMNVTHLQIEIRVCTGPSTSLQATSTLNGSTPTACMMGSSADIASATTLRDVELNSFAIANTALMILRRNGEDERAEFWASPL